MMTDVMLQPMRWSELADIDDVQPLSRDDSVVLNEIKNVLEKHGAIERFGLCLLHSHFDMADDEYLLESTNEKERCQTIRVSSDPDPDTNTIQTMWRFSTDDIHADTVCVLRCHYLSGHKQRHVKEGV